MAPEPVPVGPALPRLGVARALRRGPRSAFRWTAFVLGVTAFGAAIPTPLYPGYEARFGFGAGTLGLVFAAYTPGVFVTLFLVAPYAERIGRKPMLAIGLLLTIAGAASFALARDVAGLAAARFLQGLSVGATTSVATAAMSDLEPNRDQHHVARVATAANFGAFAIGVVASGAGVQYLAHADRWVYLLPCLAGGIGLVALASTPETAPDRSSASTVRAHPGIPDAIRVSFWVAVGGIAACYAIYGLFAALLPSFLRTGLGLENHLAGAGVVALMFGTAAGIQLATAQIRDRRALLAGFPLLVAGLLALVAILGLRSWELLVGVTIGIGGAVGLTLMGSITLIDRLAPEEERGALLAGFYLAGYLALAVPTIGVAEATDRVGLVTAGMLFGGILAATVAVLGGVLYRTPTPPGGGGRPRDAG